MSARERFSHPYKKKNLFHSPIDVGSQSSTYQSGNMLFKEINGSDY